MLFFARIDAWGDVLKEFFLLTWSIAAACFFPDYFSGHAMLLKKTISKLRAQHLTAALHGNHTSWSAETAWTAPCDSKNHFPLLFHYDSATDNPLYWYNSEAELEHVVIGVICKFFI